MQRIEKADNLLDLFEASTDRFKNNKLFGTKNRDTGEYEWVTYGDVRKRVDNLRGGLAGKGMKRGDTLGVIAGNRTEWAVAAFAAYGLGARFVPMYEKELSNIRKYIIRDAAVKFLLVANDDLHEEVGAFRDELPALEQVHVMDTETLPSMAELETAGEVAPVPSISPSPDDIAALIYTSGTTGDPKGVLLTHGNFASNARGGCRMFPQLNEDSRSLSILPWAHSYGQTAELYNWLQIGGSIGFMEKVDTLADDLVKVKPTFLIAVPRVFNRVYDGIVAKMKEKGGLAEFLFNMGVKAAKRRRELGESGQTDPLNAFKYKIADRVVFSKFRERFGGRLQGALTASATMNIEISHFFWDVGIPVFDCYGLSETSPAITMNNPDAYRMGSVGRTIENVEVRIDASAVEEAEGDGEIQVKGPNVMVGYHGKEGATEEVFTEDGWFRTGDRGRIDGDGFLYITGRLKEQYKLENGKYVFPAALEEDIRLLPYISNAMVYGDGKPYNVALLIPDFTALKEIAEKMAIKTGLDKLIHSTVVQEFVGLEVKKSLEGKYGRYEIPKKFLIIGEDFTLENGMLTQTFKLKRRKVMEKYGEQLKALYDT